MDLGRAPQLTVLAALLAALGPACADAPDPAQTEAEAGTETESQTGTQTETGDSGETEPTTTSEPTSQGLELPPPPPDLPDDAGECDELDALVNAIKADPSDADAMIDGFIAEHSYGAHGFPLVDDTRLCLVYRGSDADAVTVAGDFNGWDPAQDPLASPIPGFGYAILELDAAPAGLYKLVHPGQEFRADPLARRYGWDEFGEYSQIDPIPGRSHHERWPDFGASLGPLEARELSVWLPPDAALADALPVIYMHDGQNLFDPDALWGGWQVSATLDEALAADLVRPVVVVGVANTAARFYEYTPVEDLIDGMVVGGGAELYAELLVDQIVPFIEDRYPVSVEASERAVLGSSLGGLVSLYIAQTRREHFDHAASLSGTLSWGTFGLANPTIIDAYASAPPTGLRIYLDSGGDAGGGCPEGGADNYCPTVELAELLRDLGWVDEADLFYRWDPGAPHNEAAWAARLLPLLIDWFPGS